MVKEKTYIDKINKEWKSHMELSIQFRKDYLDWKYPEITPSIYSIIHKRFVEPYEYDKLVNSYKSISNIDMPESKKRWWVYFVLSRTTNKVKIWYSANIALRIIELQVWCPEQLELLVFVEWLTKQMEYLLHKQFIKDHYRWEWFEYSDEIKEMVLSAKEILDGKK